MAIYFASVGRGANLLLNIGPDRNGKLPNADAERIIQFGNTVKELFDENNEVKGIVEHSKNVTSITFDEFKLVNIIILSEEISGNCEIENFEVHSFLRPHG